MPNYNQEIINHVNFFLDNKGKVSSRYITSGIKAYKVMSKLYYQLRTETDQTYFSATETKLGRNLVAVKCTYDRFTAFYFADKNTLQVYIGQNPSINMVNQFEPKEKPNKKESSTDLSNVDLDNINFEDITLRSKITSRGGGVEISLNRFGFKGEKMAAYQNYLGGGLLGAVGVNDTIRSATFSNTTDQEDEFLDRLGERLKRYFFYLIQPERDFEENQKLPISSY